MHFIDKTLVTLIGRELQRQAKAQQMILRVFVSALLIAAFFATSTFAESNRAVAVVLQLYRDFAWTSVIDEPKARITFIDQPSSVLGRYLSPQLITLLKKDRECAARTREICKLEFDPIWASQDPSAAEMKIVAGALPNTVDVRYVHPGSRKVIRMRYRVLKLGTTWRIDDIEYSNGTSLRAILSQP
jgi:hypothetical protein